jgi:hypothetical protein
MTRDRFNTNFLRVLLLALLLGSGAAAAADHEVRAPEGFSFAGAELDRAGNGWVAWKDPDSLSSQLHRYQRFEATGEWSFSGYLVKGLRTGPGNRLLLNGVSPEGADLRLFTAGDSLEEIWNSAALTAEAGLDEERISLSTGFDWWYAARYLPAAVEVAAGRRGETEPLYRWTVDEVAPDAFLSVLTDTGESASGIDLALAVNGKGWLLQPSRSQPIPLVRPERCQEIITLTGGRDGLWATCGRGVQVLYPLAVEGQAAAAADAVLETRGALRTLGDRRVVTVERRPGHAGTFQVLRRGAAGRIERSEPMPFPVPPGQIAHFAGDLLLIRQGRRGEVFRAVPLPRPPG